MTDLTEAVASIQTLIDEYQARITATEEALADRDQRLAQIAELSRQPEPEQPTE